MKMFLLLITLSTTSLLYAQKEIKIEEVMDHVGDSVSLTAQVVSGRFLNASKGGPTLLNAGAPYPNQLLTLVVWKEDRDNFEEAPEAAYIKKTVRVSGRISLFKEKPQLVLYSDKQIAVIEPKESFLLSPFY
jgi:hypothetical protein